jgi:hypothetical protein
MSISRIGALHLTPIPFNERFGSLGQADDLVEANHDGVTTVSAASGSFVSGLFSCTIEVLRSGKQVGATTVGFGPPGSSSSSLQESVPVEGIKGATFAGKPSDAHEVCHVP